MALSPLLTAQLVNLAQIADEALGIVAQFGEHVFWRYEIGVIIQNWLLRRNLSD